MRKLQERQLSPVVHALVPPRLLLMAAYAATKEQGRSLLAMRLLVCDLILDAQLTPLDHLNHRIIGDRSAQLLLELPIKAGMFELQSADMRSFHAIFSSCFITPRTEPETSALFQGNAVFPRFNEPQSHARFAFCEMPGGPYEGINPIPDSTPASFRVKIVIQPH